MTTKTDSGGADEQEPQAERAPSTNGSSRAEATKPITIMLPDALLKRLRVIAVLRDKSVSEIVADHVEALVKRDLRKVLAKLEG